MSVLAVPEKVSYLSEPPSNCVILFIQSTICLFLFFSGAYSEEAGWSSCHGNAASEER